METKICNKCGIEKDLNCFSYRKDTNKYKNTCKECINIAHREFRKNNLDLMREKDREYYANNIEKRRLQLKKSNEKHKGRIKTYKKEYYKKNKEVILEKSKIYSDLNRERLKLYLRDYYQKNKLVLSEKKKQYAKHNKEKIKEWHEQYYKEHKEEIREYRREYYLEHKDELISYQQKYRRDNPDKVKQSNKKTYLKRRENDKYKEYKKEYRLKNIEKEKAYMKEYAKTHKKEINDYIKNKKMTDKVFALKIRVRQTIYDSFVRKNYSKNSKASKILGCDMDTFVNYLLNTFKNNYGYDWDGLEEIHIDHIIPLATANTEEQVIDLCHYTNLQLLKAKDNLVKNDNLNWKLEDKKDN